MAIPIRRLALAGINYIDTDWTDPANPPPGNARPFKVTEPVVIFDIIGKASDLETAIEADVGTMVVDAWVGYEGGPRDPADPKGPKTIRRGQSVVEATGNPLSTRIRIEAIGAVRGSVGRLNLALTLVGALPAVDVVIVSGARPL